MTDRSDAGSAGILLRRTNRYKVASTCEAASPDQSARPLHRKSPNPKLNPKLEARARVLVRAS
eukprot:696332-Prorocentrum_minimum.AAC.1